jgi:hypothetical protein
MEHNIGFGFGGTFLSVFHFSSNFTSSPINLNAPRLTTLLSHLALTTLQPVAITHHLVTPSQINHNSNNNHLDLAHKTIIPLEPLPAINSHLVAHLLLSHSLPIPLLDLLLGNNQVHLQLLLLHQQHLKHKDLCLAKHYNNNLLGLHLGPHRQHNNNNLQHLVLLHLEEASSSDNNNLLLALLYLEGGNNRNLLLLLLLNNNNHHHQHSLLVLNQRLKGWCLKIIAMKLRKLQHLPMCLLLQGLLVVAVEVVDSRPPANHHHHNTNHNRNPLLMVAVVV